MIYESLNKLKLQHNRSEYFNKKNELRFNLHTIWEIFYNFTFILLLNKTHASNVDKII